MHLWHCGICFPHFRFALAQALHALVSKIPAIARALHNSQWGRGMIDKKLVPEDLLQAPTRHCAGAIRFRIASAHGHAIAPHHRDSLTLNLLFSSAAGYLLAVSYMLFAIDLRW